MDGNSLRCVEEISLLHLDNGLISIHDKLDELIIWAHQKHRFLHLEQSTTCAMTPFLSIVDSAESGVKILDPGFFDLDRMKVMSSCFADLPFSKSSDITC